MFDDLLSIRVEDFAPGTTVPVEKATPEQMLEAQVATANLFADLGVPSDEDIDARVQTQDARAAFTALNFDADSSAQKLALTKIKTPEAVQHLVGMLTQYDWEFVEHAKQLRGYIVSKLVEETSHPDARIRLKALQMLGNVTEVKLFTERVEVKKIDATEDELNARLQEKLRSFLNPTVVAEVPQPPT
jgi:hypothetical protein